jgi:hypothetical protein
MTNAEGVGLAGRREKRLTDHAPDLRSPATRRSRPTTTAGTVWGPASTDRRYDCLDIGGGKDTPGEDDDGKQRCETGHCPSSGTAPLTSECPPPQDV